MAEEVKRRNVSFGSYYSMTNYVLPLACVMLDYANLRNGRMLMTLLIKTRL